MTKIDNRKVLFFSTYLFFVFAYIEETIPFGQFVTFASLALMILASNKITSHSFKIPVSGFLIYIAAMLLFCIASTIWAEDPSRTMTPIRGLFMKLLFFIIIL